MDKMGSKLVALFLLLFTLLIATRLYFELLDHWPELSWTGGMFAVLINLFGFEVIKPLLGYKRDFDTYDHRDKVVFFFALTIPMLLHAFYQKERLPDSLGTGLVARLLVVMANHSFLWQ